jgi:hypothetical protein
MYKELTVAEFMAIRQVAIDRQIVFETDECGHSQRGHWVLRVDASPKAYSDLVLQKIAALLPMAAGNWPDRAIRHFAGQRDLPVNANMTRWLRRARPMGELPSRSTSGATALRREYGASAP